jgi:hypothetical protein
VKAISGEPIVAHGKTVIPAEKIMYPKGGPELEVWAIPVQAARAEAVEEHGPFPWEPQEEKDQQTRFVPIADRRRSTAVNSQVILCLRT